MREIHLKQRNEKAIKEPVDKLVKDLVLLVGCSRRSVMNIASHLAAFRVLKPRTFTQSEPLENILQRYSLELAEADKPRHG
jgi:hypothetical protein